MFAKGFYPCEDGPFTIYNGEKELQGTWLKGEYNPEFPEIVTHNDESFKIVENTICRFTGLLGKMNVQIFDGDIVKFIDSNRWGIATITPDGKTVVETAKSEKIPLTENRVCEVLYNIREVKGYDTDRSAALSRFIELNETGTVSIVDMKKIEEIERETPLKKTIGLYKDTLMEVFFDKENECLYGVLSNKKLPCIGDEWESGTVVWVHPFRYYPSAKYKLFYRRVQLCIEGKNGRRLTEINSI